MGQNPKHMDLSHIKAFAFDIDGVMTDGGLLCDLTGEIFRIYDAKDGFSVRMATMNGFPVGVITGGRSQSIVARFRTCAIPPEDIYLGSRNKIKDFHDFCNKHNLSPKEVMFFGDDIPDIECIIESGVGVCPSDAAEEVKAAADIVSLHPGGKGCVRAAIEETMKQQGKWNFNVSVYSSLF